MYSKTENMYISMDESNTVVSTYTLYRQLQQYCSHPSICIIKLSEKRTKNQMKYNGDTEPLMFIFQETTADKITVPQNNAIHVRGKLSRVCHL